jgi:hypothetical protein
VRVGALDGDAPQPHASHDTRNPFGD